MRKKNFNWFAIAMISLLFGGSVKAANPTSSLSPTSLLAAQPVEGAWFRIESASANGNATNRNTFMYGAVEELPCYFIQPDAEKMNAGRSHPVANTFEDGFLWAIEQASEGKYYLKNKLGLYVYFTSNAQNGVSVLSKSNKTEFSINSMVFSGSTMFGFQVAAGFNLSCDANTKTRGIASLNGDGGNPSGGGAKANAFWLHGVSTKTIEIVSSDENKGTVAVKKDILIDVKYDPANLEDLTKTTYFDHFAYKVEDSGDESTLSVVKAVGNRVTMVATPIDGAAFSGWVNTADEADVLSSNLSYTHVVTDGATLKAVFYTPSAQTKTISVIATEGGTVEISGVTGDKTTVALEAGVTVVASASTGYLFEKWVDADGVALATTSQYVYLGQTDATLKAVFTALSSISRTLTISTEEGGLAQIEGTSELSKTVTADLPIVVTATPANGYKFVKWVEALTESEVTTTATYSYAGIVDISLKPLFVKLNGHTELQFSTAENPTWYTINAYYSTNSSSKWNLLSFYDESNSRWIAKGQSNTTSATVTFTEPDAALWRLEGDLSSCFLVNKATGLKINDPATAASTQRFTLTESGTAFNISKSNTLLATMEPDAFYFDPINATYASVGRLNVEGASGEFTLFKNKTADITNGKASSLVFVPVVTKTVTVSSNNAAQGSVAVLKDSIATAFASNKFTFAASTEIEPKMPAVRSTKNPTTVVATPLSEFEFEKWVDADGIEVSANSTYTFVGANDVVLTALFEASIPNSVEEQKKMVKVWSENGHIFVEGTAKYVVFHASGARVDIRQSLNRGIYFVSVDNATYKVVVK